MTDSFFFIPKSGSRLILPVERQPQLPIQKQDQCLIIKKKITRTTAIICQGSNGKRYSMIFNRNYLSKQNSTYPIFPIVLKKILAKNPTYLFSIMKVPHCVPHWSNYSEMGNRCFFFPEVSNSTRTDDSVYFL